MRKTYNRQWMQLRSLLVNIKLNMRWFFIFIGISGCFSVLFGAWLAHASQSLTPDLVDRLFTAQFYQLIHTVALLAVCLALKQRHSKALALSAILFVFGICAFSGSLYLKTFSDWPAIGKLAPFGGISLAFAWLSLIFCLTHTKE